MSWTLPGGYDHEEFLPDPRPERQGTFIPEDAELNSLVQQAQEHGLKEIWRDYFGQVMLLTLTPDRTVVPRVGPGHRNVRWMAMKDSARGWTWLESGSSGFLPRGYRECEALVILYRWPVLNPPGQPEQNRENEVYVSTEEISNREKVEVLRAHVNLGHPHEREFVRLLRAAGTKESILQYVLREFSCAGCAKERRPPTRLPSATPRRFDFNIVVGVDLVFLAGVTDRADLPVLNITCMGTLYSSFGLIDYKRRSSSATWSAFNRLWLRVFGAPQCVMYDEGKEFTGAPFQDGLEMHGIQPVEINRQAPFELGTAERRGGMFKSAYYRTRELRQPQTIAEVEDMIFEVSWAIQTLTNRSGYSPAHAEGTRETTVTELGLSCRRSGVPLECQC